MCEIIFHIFYKYINYINKYIEIFMTIGNPSCGNQVYICMDTNLEQDAHFCNVVIFFPLTEFYLQKLL
jgi:hypothetical protein